jgi:hypothetical protein
MTPDPSVSETWEPLEILPRVPQKDVALLHHRHNTTTLCLACEIIALRADVDSERASRLRAEQENKQLTAEWSVMARACGNWRDFGTALTPEAVQRRQLIDDADYQAAARAIVQRNELEAERTRLLAALKILHDELESRHTKVTDEELVAIRARVGLPERRDP